jgi:hypothetical protein
MWDHVLEVHLGQGNEEIHKDFNFFLAASFQKPLERQVDEMRRLDLVAKKGKATITIGHLRWKKEGYQGAEREPKQKRREV